MEVCVWTGFTRLSVLFTGGRWYPVNTVMYVHIPQKCENFVTTYVNMGFSRDPCSSKLVYITNTFPEVVCIHSWFQQTTWNGSIQYLNVNYPVPGVNIPKPWNADLTTLLAQIKASPSTLPGGLECLLLHSGRLLYFFTLSILLLYIITAFSAGWDNAVGIATGYGLDSPEFKPQGGEIFRTRPDWPWGPPSILYNWYRVSVQEVKQPGARGWPPTPSGAEVKDKVELYLYFLSGPSWRVLEGTSSVTEFSSLNYLINTITRKNVLLKSQ